MDIGGVQVVNVAGDKLDETVDMLWCDLRCDKRASLVYRSPTQRFDVYLPPPPAFRSSKCIGPAHPRTKQQW